MLEGEAHLVDPAQGGLGVVEAAEGEVELLAVMDRQQRVSQGSRFCRFLGMLEEVFQGVEVSAGLRHLFAIDDQVLGMQPMPGEGLAGGRFALGDLVLMMRKDVVYPSAMDVEGLTEVLHAHRGAFEVPAGAARPPGGVPVRLTGLGPFPEHEVPRILLAVLVVRHPFSLAHLVQIEAGEPSVVLVPGNAEEDRALAFVGVALLDQLLDQRNHLGHMLGRPRVALGGLDMQGSEILEKRLGKRPRVVRERELLFSRAGDRLVIDIGDVHDLIDLVAQMAQASPQNVFEDKRSQVADVGMVVDGGATGVELDFPRLECLERLLPPAESVVEAGGGHAERASSRRRRR